MGLTLESFFGGCFFIKVVIGHFWSKCGIWVLCLGSDFGFQNTNRLFHLPKRQCTQHARVSLWFKYKTAFILHCNKFWESEGGWLNQIWAMIWLAKRDRRERSSNIPKITIVSVKIYGYWVGQKKRPLALDPFNSILMICQDYTIVSGTSKYPTLPWSKWKLDFRNRPRVHQSFDQNGMDIFFEINIIWGCLFYLD